MKLFFVTVLLVSGNAKAVQSAELPLTLTSANYITYDADVYDGQTGKTFPYRVSPSMEMGGCSGGEFTIKEVGKFMSTITYFVQMNALTPAIFCEKPPRQYSKFFDFNKGPGFISIVIPTNVSVRVERLEE